jgi:hypothetical protein
MVSLEWFIVTTVVAAMFGMIAYSVVSVILTIQDTEAQKNRVMDPVKLKSNVVHSLVSIEDYRI